MSLKKLWLKVTNRHKYLEHKHEKIRETNKSLYEKKIKIYLDKVDKIINLKKEISFLHSGHLGDLINALPLIKEISKKKEM